MTIIMKSKRGGTMPDKFSAIEVHYDASLSWVYYIKREGTVLLDWTTGLDYWNGLLDWHFLAIQGGIILLKTNALHGIFSTKQVFCFKLVNSKI